MKDTLTSSNIKYSQDEICPICGRYQPDGEVCKECLKEYEIYKPKERDYC